MKNKIIIILSVVSLSLFFSCSGNHTASGGSDTAAYKYKQQPSADTAAITTTTGDASNIDNSGSGGTRIDTGKKGIKKDTVKK